MIEEILPNIYRIPVPLPRNPLKELNAYLIRGADRSLLIDTGFALPACRQALSEGLDEACVERTRLDILLTHIHTDHCGLAEEFVSEDGCIYVGDGDHLLTNQTTEDAFWYILDRRFYQEGFPVDEQAVVKKTNPARKLGPHWTPSRYRPLADGATLTVGDYTLKIVATPGHTPGQICLFIKSEGLFFSADHVLFDITPNIAIWPNMDNALGSYLDSLRKVQSYPVQLALPGHRHSADFGRRVEELLLHHQNRVAETLAIIEREPDLTAYDIAARMTWDIRAKSWADFPVNQKWFAMSEALAHLDYLRAEGAVVRRVAAGGFYRYTAG